MTDSDFRVDEAVERLRAGDDDALAGLFSFYRPNLWKMVDFRLDGRLAGRIDPSDVIQEAYIDAAKRVRHFQRAESASFLSWIRQIVEQTVIDLHRRHLASQKRDVRREIKGGIGMAPTSTCLVSHILACASTPSQNAVQAEFEERIEQAINRMDPIDREVLALRHFEELSNNEVAELLGLKASAASNRYFRALKRLRSILEQMPELFQESADLLDPPGER